MAKSARRHLLAYTTCVLVATCTSGCGGATAEHASASGDGGSVAPIANATPQTSSQDAKELQLRGVDYDGLLQFIASHQGHPIVLDIWSTSCDPCIRELPNLAKLHADFKDRGVVCASLNIDFTGAEGTTPDEAKARAREVLDALDVHVHNLYSTVSDRELYRTQLFKENQVYSIPAILVFDPSGKVKGRFGDASDGDSPYAKVRAAIYALL